MITDFEYVTKGFSPRLRHVMAFELVSVPNYGTYVRGFSFWSKDQRQHKRVTCVTLTWSFLECKHFRVMSVKATGKEKKSP